LQVRAQRTRVVEQFVGNLIGKVLLEHRAELFPRAPTFEWPHGEFRCRLGPRTQDSGRIGLATGGHPYMTVGPARCHTPSSFRGDCMVAPFRTDWRLMSLLPAASFGLALLLGFLCWYFLMLQAAPYFG